MSSHIITVVNVRTSGKGGAQRTIHTLSNGWWINDMGLRGQRTHRYSLYKPGVGGPGRQTFVRGDDNFARLLEYASTHAGTNTEQKTNASTEAPARKGKHGK